MNHSISIMMISILLGVAKLGAVTYRTEGEIEFRLPMSENLVRCGFRAECDGALGTSKLIIWKLASPAVMEYEHSSQPGEEFLESIAARAPFIDGTVEALGSQAAYELALTGSRAAFWGGTVTSAYTVAHETYLTPTPTPGGAVQELINGVAFDMIRNADTASQGFAAQNQRILGDLSSALTAYQEGGCK